MGCFRVIRDTLRIGVPDHDSVPGGAAEGGIVHDQTVVYFVIGKSTAHARIGVVDRGESSPPQQAHMADNIIAV